MILRNGARTQAIAHVARIRANLTIWWRYEGGASKPYNKDVAGIPVRKVNL